MSKPRFKLYPLLSFNESADDFEGLEDGRNHLLYRVFFWIGTAFIGTFCLISFWTGRIDLAIVLGTMLLLVIGVNIYVIRYGNLQLAGYCYGAILVVMIWFLIWNGGVNGTGPLWIYPCTVIIISILGYIHGLIFSSVAWVGCAVMLLLEIPVAPQINYEFEYSTRLLATWFALIGLTWGIEFSRAKAYRHMQEFNAQVQKNSLTDPLTNILNRRGLTDLFQSEESRFRRTGDTFSLLMLDIDNFKQINDTHGHRIGDEILRHISLIMNDHIRGMDVIGRWGGEEFIILLSGTNNEEALEVAEKLRGTVADYRGFPYHENTPLTISIGVTGYQNDMSIEQMVERADRAMYVAKRSGKNRVETL